MDVEILSAAAFYSAEIEYYNRVDPSWEPEIWRAGIAEERSRFEGVLGRADGRAILDCSCGTGRQAIPLAQSGWRVTATDVTEAYLDIARHHAAGAGVSIRFLPRDMRELAGYFDAQFDWVISCMALDNILDDDGIQKALHGMCAALKPGGHCYIRLRDMDQIINIRPRFDFSEERLLPHGRVISIEDWYFESESQVVNSHIFLWEDRRRLDYAWTTDVFAYRRRALRKAELTQLLHGAGFEELHFLPQPSPWHPYEVVAHRGTRTDSLRPA